jgi:hypothetical protein
LDSGAPAGASINPASGVFTWIPNEGQGPGTNTVTIRVTDNGSPPLNDFETITITVGEVNAAPVLPVIGNKTVVEGSLLSFTVTATDADTPGQTLVYSLDAGAPAGASVDATTGVFTWRPSETQGPAMNNVTIRVTDNGSPSLNDSETITITVTEANSEPILAFIADKIVTEGTQLSFTVIASDSDMPTNSLSFSLGVASPAGASIHPTTGLFTWVPNEEQGPGTNIIAVFVNDNGSPALSTARIFTVVVLESNSPPVLMPVSNYVAQVLVPLRVTNVVTDADVPTNRVTFELVQAPKGVRINKFTGVLTWSPAREQARTTNMITVAAMDEGNPSLSVSNTFLVVVDDYLELSLGTTVLRAGELGSVPVNLVASTTPVTNLSSSLLLASQRLVDRSLTSFAPELSSATLQSEAPNVEKMIFNTTNGQVLRQSRLLARFNFTALANQSSAFVPLVLSNIVALQTNGLAVPRTLASAGRVVVVGREPLLESLLSTNLERSLILYGEPGSGYLVESTTDPSDENSWQPVWQGTLTTLSLSIAPATLTNDITFFRAIRQVAPGQDR